MLQADIRRGELDRDLTFIEEVHTTGDSNEDIISWREITTNPTVKARRRELPGREVAVGDQLKYVQRTEFVIVYRTDLNEKNRCVFGGRVYEIISVTETAQRKMYLQIMANLLDTEVWT